MKARARAGSRKVKLTVVPWWEQPQAMIIFALDSLVIGFRIKDWVNGPHWAQGLAGLGCMAALFAAMTALISAAAWLRKKRST